MQEEGLHKKRQILLLFDLQHRSKKKYSPAAYRYYYSLINTCMVFLEI